MLFLAFGAPTLGVVVASVLSVADSQRPRTLITLSRRGAMLATAAAVVMLALFYSLAVHMYLALGEWPQSIGEHGFPPALVSHGYLATRFFSALAVIGISLVPVASILGVAIRPARRLMPYLGVYVTACAIALGIMQLAPARFLYWWWD